MKKIRVLETFSGIGAPRKALERLGFDYEIVDSIEIDPYPVKAYNAIFGDNTVPQDITKWNKTKEEIGEVDLLWNSSPCTDISIAGKNEGAKKGSETRSSLVWEVIKIAERIQPKYIVWENVKNLTSPKHIGVLNEYIGDLEKIGYKSTYKVLNAKDYEIPQNRERVFVVSIRNDIDRPFVFPKPQELKLYLRDMLEDKVDEKYYLSEEMLEKIKFENRNFKRDNENEVKEVIRKYGVFDTEKNKHQAGSVYGKNGIAPTLDTMQGGWRQPCIEVEDNGFVTRHYKNFIQKNGYVPEMFNPYNETELTDIAPTQATNCGCTTVSSTVLIKEKPQVIGGVGEKKSNSGRQWYQQDRIYDNEIGLSISTKFNPYYIDNEFRIRRLTPLETFRLMGFDDSDFYKAKETGLSDSRLYKMAGNSIVVNVVEAIFKNLFYEYYIPPIIYIEDEEHE